MSDVSDYERCLREMCVEQVSVNSIRSDHHKLYTYNVNKIGLSAYDDKRYICDDGVHMEIIRFELFI